jgi:hypothetical protein
LRSGAYYGIIGAFEIFRSQNPVLSSKMSKAEKDLLREIESTEGAELPKPCWRTAERLRERGKITLTGPRGPEGYFRRAELIE